VVYRVRAAWCFEVLGTSQRDGHGRQFCRNQSSCVDCVYYRRVCCPSVTVLVITADETLVSQLKDENNDSVATVFASNSYEASALISTVRPGFVILDEDLCRNCEPQLLSHLVRDDRVPGLKIFLCGPRGCTLDVRNESIHGRLDKPFDRGAIAVLTNRFPVERRPVEQL
jgi:hypothetical protein